MAVVDRHAFVFAHPDDEFACSGVIAGLVKKGDDVRCVYLTDGGHGGQSIERRRKEGHYLLDHTCDECWAIRSGRVTSLDYDAEGNYIGTLPDATP